MIPRISHISSKQQTGHAAVDVWLVPEQGQGMLLARLQFAIFFSNHLKSP